MKMSSEMLWCDFCVYNWNVCFWIVQQFTENGIYEINKMLWTHLNVNEKCVLKNGIVVRIQLLS